MQGEVPKKGPCETVARIGQERRFEPFEVVPRLWLLSGIASYAVPLRSCSRSCANCFSPLVLHSSGRTTDKVSPCPTYSESLRVPETAAFVVSRHWTAWKTSPEDRARSRMLPNLSETCFWVTPHLMSTVAHNCTVPVAEGRQRGGRGAGGSCGSRLCFRRLRRRHSASFHALRGAEDHLPPSDIWLHQ